MEREPWVKWAIRGTTALLVLLVVSCSVGTIQTGNVGVRTTMGTVSSDEVLPGVYFRVPIFQSIDEYVAKETVVALDDLKPKAKDNLSLRDLDVSIYYRVAAASIAELMIKYKGQAATGDHVWYPAFHLIASVGRGAIYDQVAQVDSLVLHTKRDQIERGVQEALQREMDASDKGVFTITRVVVRSVVTDPAIEESIRNAVQAHKQLEQIEIQNEIAKKQADIRITEARGIAEANRIINNTLTREYLQHETNIVLEKLAKQGTHTVIVPANMQVAPIINLK